MESGLRDTKAHGRRKADSRYERALLLAKSGDNSTKLGPIAKLLQAAHERGDRRATYAIGTWYFHGRLFDQDERKGFLMMLEAADDFVADACFDVAISYEIGRGVRKNLKKAAVYYLRAMMLGEKQSISEVGRLLYWGIGVAKDRALAKELDHFVDASPK